MEYLERSREEALDFLASCYADTILTLEEYEERVDRVTGAQSVAQVENAVSDLRSLTVRRDGQHSDLPADAGQSVVSIMTSRKLQGNWLRNRFVSSTTLLASTVLDLRDCTIEPGTRIHIVSIMGETKVILPEDVELESSITPFMAEVNDSVPRASAGAPRLILTGFALMSEVNVIGGSWRRRGTRR